MDEPGDYPDWPCRDLPQMNASNSMLGCGSTTPQDYPEWSGFGR